MRDGLCYLENTKIKVLHMNSTYGGWRGSTEGTYHRVGRVRVQQGGSGYSREGQGTEGPPRVRTTG